ncbi:MAG: glycosyltransferase family 2 protein [Candidatus Obscuribacterales bacterium]|nr:glycosyltransferase family 2 protein [Candidatus Obscuribacterales bacterium]
MTRLDRKVPVSIIIPIKNEAGNLPRCLASVSWADEVFVVDSKSTDASIEISESFGAKVVQFEFNGVWPKKKNWALDNLPLSHDWVFILDADEVLPPEAEAEFNAIVTAPVNPESDAIGYWINRRMMFMNKWLKHAYYPNWNLRLFLHKHCRYEKLIDEATASGDNEVHEHVVVNGRTERLKSEMEHYAFPTVEIFVEKHNRYSNWEARYTLSQAKRQQNSKKLDNKEVRLTRRLKNLMQSMPFRPLLRFLYVYIWQKGFLDGIEGYYFARLHGFYEFLTVLKIYELKNSPAARKSD